MAARAVYSKYDMTQEMEETRKGLIGIIPMYN